MDGFDISIFMQPSVVAADVAAKKELAKLHNANGVKLYNDVIGGWISAWINTMGKPGFDKPKPALLEKVADEGAVTFGPELVCPEVATPTLPEPTTGVALKGAVDTVNPKLDALMAMVIQLGKGMAQLLAQK